MEIIQILINILLGIVVFYLTTVEKRLSDMQRKLEDTMKRTEVERVIELEIKPVRNEQSNLKEDLHRIEGKLDKLLDKIMKVIIT